VRVREPSLPVETGHLQSLFIWVASYPWAIREDSKACVLEWTRPVENTCRYVDIRKEMVGCRANGLEETTPENEAPTNVPRLAIGKERADVEREVKVRLHADDNVQGLEFTLYQREANRTEKVLTVMAVKTLESADWMPSTKRFKTLGTRYVRKKKTRPSIRGLDELCVNLGDFGQPHFEEFGAPLRGGRRRTSAFLLLEERDVELKVNELKPPKAMVIMYLHRIFPAKVQNLGRENVLTPIVHNLWREDPWRNLRLELGYNSKINPGGELFLVWGYN
jgi:hypothetical protein